MKKKKLIKNMSTLRIDGLPETAFDMVNRYGTYEIQSTADTENQYPCIAQGFNKKQINNDCENPDNWILEIILHKSWQIVYVCYNDNVCKYILKEYKIWLVQAISEMV